MHLLNVIVCLVAVRLELLVGQNKTFIHSKCYMSQISQLWKLSTPLNHAAMLKRSDRSDPDLQRYLRHTYTDRQTDRQRFLAFIERYRFLSSSLSDKKGVLRSLLHQKQPFYFFQKLCLHRIVTMNILKSNIQQKTCILLAVARQQCANEGYLMSTQPSSSKVPVELVWPVATLALVRRCSDDILGT